MIDFPSHFGYHGNMKRNATPPIDVKKYGGKQVGILNGKIVAAGKDAQEVLGKVRKKFPATSWRDVLLVSVPKGITVVYRI